MREGGGGIGGTFGVWDKQGGGCRAARGNETAHVCGQQRVRGCGAAADVCGHAAHKGGRKGCRSVVLGQRVELKECSLWTAAREAVWGRSRLVTVGCMEWNGWVRMQVVVSGGMLGFGRGGVSARMGGRLLHAAQQAWREVAAACGGEQHGRQGAWESGVCFEGPMGHAGV